MREQKLTFEKIMAYHPQNKQVFELLKNRIGSVIPFVGAGLSAFCYPQWTQALKDMANNIRNRKNKREIVNAIQSNPIQAADLLEKYLGQKSLEGSMLSIFNEEKITKSSVLISEQSVYLLPYLFPTVPVVTTNFDRVLSYVYNQLNKPFDTTILPRNTELHNQLMQGNRHGLLKLHGDIGKEMIEYGSIVFTQRQYEEVYREGSDLVTELRRWFENRMMLFLGCSLDKDQTLDILSKVSNTQTGIYHFAILEHKRKVDIDARLRSLADDYSIRAIVYPYRRHEAVRIILEKLLEELEPDAYQGLSYRASALTQGTAAQKNPFAYDAGIVSFVGRDSEQKQLEDFCNTDEPLKWWAVTGPGGAGKSRLVYEFTNKLRKQGWNIQYLERADYDELKQYDHTTENTVIVADYVRAYMREIAHWLEHLTMVARSSKMRVLLLEREGKALSDTYWDDSFTSAMQQRTVAQQICYQQEFLQLYPLSENDLKEIIREYAQESGKPLKEDIANRLMQSLKKVDADLRRPLYALFLTDAWIHGKKPENWNQDKILNYVIQRERNDYEEKAKQLCGTQNKKLKTVLNEVKAIATIYGDIPLSQMESSFTEVWKRLQQCADKIDEVDSEQNLLEYVGFCNSEEQVVALRPDLVGEYFVIQILQEKKQWNLLFVENWEKNLSIWAFLYRISLDYGKQLDEIFWKLFFEFNFTEDNIYMYIYSAFLVNLSAIGVQVSKAVCKLKVLYNRFSKNEELVVMYANGLVNLSIEQEEEEARETVDKLRELYKNSPENKDIALLYAQGLFNLTCEKKGVKQIVKVLKELYERRPDDANVVVLYAKGLVNLSIEQKTEEAEQTVKELRKLFESIPENEELMAKYAKGLMNLSSKQEDAKETMRELKQLHERKPENEELTVVYACALFNLSLKQDTEEATATISELKKLYESGAGSKEWIVTYAKALVNLSNKLGEKERNETIEELRKLYQSSPENEQLTVIYASELVDLLYCQGKGKTEEIVGELKKLYENMPGNEELAVMYAKGLINLSAKQEAEETKETVGKLKELHESSPANEELVMIYANGLVDLSAKQRIDEIKETVGELRNLHKSDLENEELAVTYAKGLFNLSLLTFSKQEIEGIVGKLRKLYESKPENEQLAVEYAKCVMNLSINQEKGEAYETIMKLKKLYESRAKNEELAVIYGTGLFNLSIKQEIEEATEMMRQLKKLNQDWLQNEDLAVIYAKGLVNSLAWQKKEDTTKTIGELRKLYDTWSENEELIMAYAKGLLNLSAKQEKKETKETIERIKKLHESKPKSEELVGVYVLGLLNLLKKQEETEACETIRELKSIAEKYIKEILFLFARKEKIILEQALEKTRRLKEKYPHNQDVMVIYVLFKMIYDGYCNVERERKL